MNNDLISRKALVKILLAEREHYPPMVAERYSFGVKLPHHFNQAMRGGIRKALRAVETAPAVDAVEVVRCKDCKHRGDAYECPMYFVHYHGDDLDRTDDDGFCECGAKMDLED